MTLPDLLALRARERPDHPALVTLDGEISWEELSRTVEEQAAVLERYAPAPPPGSPRPSLALMLERHLDAVVAIHAGARAGLAVAPLGPDLTSPELEAALAALDPVAVVCSPEHADRVGTASGSRSVLVSTPGEGWVGRETRSGEEPGSGREAGSGAGLPPDVDFVLWTSGSTAAPRAVALRERALEVVARGSAERLGLGPGDRWLTTLSPAHMGGLATIHRAAAVGGSLVARDSFDAGELLDLADRGKVTHASLVPVMLRRLLEERPGPAPSALACLLVGGALAPRELVEEATGRGFPVALTYGMSETSSQVATAPPRAVRARTGSVGLPLPGVEVRIAGGREIRVRGQTLAAGYLPPPAGRSAGDPGAPSLVSLDLDEDGWLRTGDLGSVDDEGKLTVTGRRSQRIVTGGVTVDPAEVEEALLRIPGVREAGVVGLPDEEWGERVCAAVVLDDRAAAREDGLPEAEIRARLGGARKPRTLQVVEHLPRTRSGKLDRNGLRALFRFP